MSENENFDVEQEVEVVAEQEVAANTDNDVVVEQEVVMQTKNNKKFNVLSIIVIVTLGLSVIMGIVGICIAWLSAKMPTGSVITDTLKELIDSNKIIEIYKNLEAIEAFAILTIIFSAFALASYIVSKLVNIKILNKVLSYVTPCLSALVIVSALLSIILTVTCTSTDVCIAAKDEGMKFSPAAGAWLLTVFGVIGGIMGIIGTLDSDGTKSKETLRKQTVNLKRKPQRIPFLFLLVTSVFYLFCLNDFSRTSSATLFDIDWLGLCVFVNSLFSILVLVLFMNAFPKHPIVNKKTGKKHKVNITMLVLGFVFIGIMIFMDAFYIYQFLNKAIAGRESLIFSTVDEAKNFSKYLSSGFLANPELDLTRYKDYILRSYTYAIAHIVLLGVTIIVYALLPLFKKLLMKINTRKVIEENNITEVIDTED